MFPQLAITKLPAEKYPTIYYIIPEVFLIYMKLENFKVNFRLFIDAINSGIAKLRKYYLRLGILNNKSKNFYILLILDFRLKEGLKALGFFAGFISDIKARLKTNFNVYKADYLRDDLIIDSDGDINIYNAEDINELGIYASDDDDLEEDEITAYLSEKRLIKT
ncbi:hypothetical protein BKA65DRAFT_485123 [Rhexocercosporidium sp. MPI-PUGE-AT-0058]|nr:hypothetical protein BKA65DRAFT_485123 [Rhexocercosporidium sp. MPI-PUGE-AT-0058]